jgi:hypothetical protein
LWVIRTFLKAHPLVWVELDVTGTAAVFMKNAWMLGKSENFPSTQYAVEVVDGRLFVMYASADH